jgi:large subunit ribosomal protein L24
MKIKKGDKVQVLAGKDKGKTGKVLQIFPTKNRASVEGINLLIKHLRPTRQGEKGQRIEFPAPMEISNLMFVCPKCKKATRIEYKVTEADKDGKTKKFRACKKCNKAID